MDHKFPLLTADIQKIIPHRYPMLLVDRVLEFKDGEYAIGQKNVSANEGFFSGHFPGRPIMPGVITLESLAQLGVIFARLCSDGVDGEGLYVFAGCENVKFRRPIVPGDVVRLEMRLIKRRGGIWKMQGTASVDGEVAVEGILIAAATQNRKL